MLPLTTRGATEATRYADMRVNGTVRQRAVYSVEHRELKPIRVDSDRPSVYSLSQYAEPGIKDVLYIAYTCLHGPSPSLRHVSVLRAAMIASRDDPRSFASESQSERSCACCARVLSRGVPGAVRVVETWGGA